MVACLLESPLSNRSGVEMHHDSLDMGQCDLDGWMAFHEELESEGFDTSSFTCSFMLENAMPKKAEPFQDNVNRGCEARFTNVNDMASHFCLGDDRMCVKLLLVELALRTAKDHRERVKEVSAETVWSLRIHRPVTVKMKRLTHQDPESVVVMGKETR